MTLTELLHELAELPPSAARPWRYSEHTPSTYAEQLKQRDDA
jgi:hypothetical protein